MRNRSLAELTLGAQHDSCLVSRCHKHRAKHDKINGQLSLTNGSFQTINTLIFAARCLESKQSADGRWTDGTVAEWSKAVESGSTLNWRGFESHRYHFCSK